MATIYEGRIYMVGICEEYENPITQDFETTAYMTAGLYKGEGKWDLLIPEHSFSKAHILPYDTEKEPENYLAKSRIRIEKITSMPKWDPWPYMTTEKGGEEK